MPLQDIDTELRKAEFELIAHMLRQCARYTGDIEPTNEIKVFETDTDVTFVLPKGGSITIHPDGTWSVVS